MTSNFPSLFKKIVLICLLVVCDSICAEQVGERRKSTTLTNQPRLTTPEAIEDWVERTLTQYFELGPDNALSQESQPRHLGNQQIVAVNQTYLGKPVIGGESRVVLAQDGEPIAVLGNHPNVAIKPHTMPPLPEDSLPHKFNLAENGELSVRTVYWPKPSSEYVLAYEYQGDFVDEDGTYRPRKIVIDAYSAEVLEEVPLVFHAKNRQVNDFEAACRTMGINFPLISPIYERVERKAEQSFARTEHSPASDKPQVEQAFELLGEGYDFMRAILGMDSIDDSGILLNMFVSVHFQSGLPTIQCYGNTFNAVWMAHKQSLYIPDAGLNLVEVTMHELAHGIVSNGSNLEYLHQSGALNESIADSIGVTFRVWREHAGKSTTSPTVPRTFWRLRIPGTPGRDMANPNSGHQGTVVYPDHMDNYLYWPKSKDNGGVHYNSSIFNLAFYLLASGGKHPNRNNGPEVVGIGIYDAAKIVSQAAAKLLVQKSSFEDARFGFAQAAESLYGEGSQQWISVHQAMDAVGIAGTWEMPEPEPEPLPEVEPEAEPTPVPEPETTSSTKDDVKPSEDTTQNGIPKHVLLLIIGGLGLVVAAFVTTRFKPKYDEPIASSPVSNTPVSVTVPLVQNNVPSSHQAPGVDARFDKVAAVQPKPNIRATSSAGRTYSHHTSELGLQSLDGVQFLPLYSTLLASAEGLVIGRALELVHIHLEDEKVSRRHLRFRQYQGRLTLEDLNSTFGTLLDGDPVVPFEPVTIENGQLIRIAEFSYVIKFS